MSLDDLIIELPLEAWRGAAHAWHCDEMGHFNSAFYVSCADEALAALSAALMLGKDVNAVFKTTCHHLRFIKEIRAGTSLAMKCGLLSADETGIEILLVLINLDINSVCAVIKADVVLKKSKNELPASFYMRCQDLLVSLPRDAYSRTITDSLPRIFPAFDLAEEYAMPQTAMGCFLPSEAKFRSDEVLVDTIIHRISGATRFLSRLFESTAKSYDKENIKLGSAAMEVRLDYLAWPKVGDRFFIRSGFSQIGENTSRRLVHWFFDADTNMPLSVIQSLEVNFNLDTRKSHPVHPKVKEDLESFIFEELAPGSKFK